MKCVFLFVVLIAVVYAQRRPSGSRANLSECQQKRAQAQDKLIVGGLIPECEDNGDYSSKQCHPPNVRGKQFCQCWKKDGRPITQPSTKLKNCACVRQKDEVQDKKTTGLFEPQCQEDGSYQAKQCHASTCWCVDSAGKNKTQPISGDPKCA